jgi:hypothetical protein
LGIVSQNHLPLSNMQASPTLTSQTTTFLRLNMQILLRKSRCGFPKIRCSSSSLDLALVKWLVVGSNINLFLFASIPMLSPSQVGHTRDHPAPSQSLVVYFISFSGSRHPALRGLTKQIPLLEQISLAFHILQSLVIPRPLMRAQRINEN